MKVFIVLENLKENLFSLLLTFSQVSDHTCQADSYRCTKAIPDFKTVCKVKCFIEKYEEINLKNKGWKNRQNADFPAKIVRPKYVHPPSIYRNIVMKRPVRSLLQPFRSLATSLTCPTTLPCVTI